MFCWLFYVVVSGSQQVVCGDLRLGSQKLFDSNILVINGSPKRGGGYSTNVENLCSFSVVLNLIDNVSGPLSVVDRRIV
jgi:hypothetical protein